MSTRNVMGLSNSRSRGFQVEDLDLSLLTQAYSNTSQPRQVERTLGQDLRTYTHLAFSLHLWRSNNTAPACIMGWTPAEAPTTSICSLSCGVNMGVASHGRIHI